MCESGFYILINSNESPSKSNTLVLQDWSKSFENAISTWLAHIFTRLALVACLYFKLLLVHFVNLDLVFRKSRHFLDQSEVKPKPIVTRSRTFSRALNRLHVFALCFDWSTGLSVSFFIGQNDSFGFGFRL